MSYPKPDFVRNSWILLPEDDKNNKNTKMTLDEFKGREGVDRMTEEERKEYFKDFLPIPKP